MIMAYNTLSHLLAIIVGRWAGAILQSIFPFFSLVVALDQLTLLGRLLRTERDLRVQIYFFQFPGPDPFDYTVGRMTRSHQPHQLRSRPLASRARYLPELRSSSNSHTVAPTRTRFLTFFLTTPPIPSTSCRK